MLFECDCIPAVAWRESALELLDQRLLPGEVRYRRLTAAADVAQAIREMVVRGAPAIGIAAAYGVVLAARIWGGAGGSDPPCRSAGSVADTDRRGFRSVGGVPADRRQSVLGTAADGACARRDLGSRSGGTFIGRSAGDSRRGYRRQPADGATGGGLTGRANSGADPLQCWRAGDGWLRHGAGRDSRGIRGGVGRAGLRGWSSGSTRMKLGRGCKGRA